MPEFVKKEIKVFACNTCPKDPADLGEPNHRNVKGMFDCPDHTWHREIGPRPEGIPRRAPCPGSGTEGPHDVYARKLMCRHCEDGVWYDPPAE